jgi:bifunctional non-homologous end joining protein LigD
MAESGWQDGSSHVAMTMHFAPMLASLVEAPLVDRELVYEPKYDGIRGIVDVDGTGREPSVRIWSRLGNEKTNQFPEVTAALAKWAARTHRSVVLDGEIVALDAKGQPAGFQQLQGRIHVEDPGPAGARGGRERVALVAFDLLRDGDQDLRGRPFLERRAALERVFGKTGSPILRVSEIAAGDGRALYRHALDRGWEGLIAKHAQSVYKSGKRTPDWRKLKIVHEQEFVIAGWTEPRQSRHYFGALLLGVYEPAFSLPAAPARNTRSARARRARPARSARRLVYVGHTGTGFNERELSRLMALLEPLETPDCPFDVRPKTNERPHWVKPEIVAEIKFTEWTADGKLRHPVYVGLRDDKRAEDVVREEQAQITAGSRRITAASPDRGETDGSAPAVTLDDVVDQLRALEQARKDGGVELPGGARVQVTNLHKVFWPAHKLTKGDLFRYYVAVSPMLLPAIADRPLVMKRFPNGVDRPPFYQHRVDNVPAGVRVEPVSAEAREQIIGGDLQTLMYTTQLAAISEDPWFSRVGSPGAADYAALDLDPPDEAPFSKVLDVARWIRDELAELGAEGVPKTSGASGLHVYIPLPPGTPYEAGVLFCQIVATLVVQKHPKAATLERSVGARGGRVYVDYMQNAPGKTLASAYSARASAWAGVSTPLTWKEVDHGLEREAWTIRTVPARLQETGDLWAALRTSKGVDLSRVAKYTTKRKPKSR